MSGRTLTSSLIVRLIDQVSGPAKKIAASLGTLTSAGRNGVIGRLSEAQERNSKALDRARLTMVDATAQAWALKSALSAAIRPTIDLENAFADLKKVANFSDGEEKAAADAIKRLSRELGKSQAEVAKAMADASQAGTANNDLEEMARLVLQAGVAWDVSADTASTALAKTRTAMGWTIGELRTFADEINKLSDTTAASSPELLDFQARVMAAGKVMGFSAEQTLALGASMISAGFQADVAGTTFLNVGRALNRGASATKRQSAAYKSLGLNARQVAKDTQKKGGLNTLVDILNRVEKLPAEKRQSVLSDLFGDEARALAPLIGHQKELLANYDAIADKQKTAGSVSQEFENRSKTTARALERLSVAMENIGIAIGQSITPALADLAAKMEPVAKSFADFADRNPELVAGIVKLGVALVSLRAGTAVLRWLGLSLNGALIAGAIRSLKALGTAAGAIQQAVGLQAALAAMDGVKYGGLARLGTALGALAGLVPGLSGLAGAIGGAAAALTAPAWAAIAAGVALVAGAGLMLYKYWDRVSSVVSGVASRLGEEFAPAIQRLQPILGPTAAAFRAMGDAAAWVGDGLKKAWEAVSSWFSNMLTPERLTDGQKASWEAAGRNLADSMINSIKSAFDGLMSWFAGLPGRIISAIGKIDLSGLIKWPSMPSFGGGSTPKPDGSAPPSGHRARGGSVWSGGSFVVGENGPERFTPGKSGTITPNGGGGVAPQVHIAPGAIVIQGIADMATASRQAARMIGDDIARQLRGSHADMPARS